MNAELLRCPDCITDCKQNETTVKFMADTVEHNLCTLNGENTLHTMGMIPLITYEKLLKRKEEILFRRKRFWVCYLLVCYLLYKDKYWHETITIFQPVYSNRILHTSNVDLLFNLAWMFKNPVPLWPGTWSEKCT